MNKCESAALRLYLNYKFKELTGNDCMSVKRIDYEDGIATVVFNDHRMKDLSVHDRGRGTLQEDIIHFATK